MSNQFGRWPFFLRQCVAYFQTEKQVVSFKKETLPGGHPPKKRKNRRNVTQETPPHPPTLCVNDISEFLKKNIFWKKDLSMLPPYFCFKIDLSPLQTVNLRIAQHPWNPGTERNFPRVNLKGKFTRANPGTHLYHSRSQHLWRVLVR